MIKINMQFFGGNGASSKKAGGGAGAKATGITKQPIPKSKVTVSNTEYIFAHGKAPSGTGNWAFEIDGEVEFFYGKFSEAKNKAVTLAAKKGIHKIKVGS